MDAGIGVFDRETGKRLEYPHFFVDLVLVVLATLYIFLMNHKRFLPQRTQSGFTKDTRRSVDSSRLVNNVRRHKLSQMTKILIFNTKYPLFIRCGIFIPENIIEERCQQTKADCALPVL